MRLGSLIPFSNKSHEIESMKDPFALLQREINSLFERPFGSLSANMFGAEGLKIDVRDDEKKLVVTAEVPGITEKDLSINLTNNILTIQGEKKSEKKEGDTNYYMSERSYGTFSRSLQLPFQIKPEQVEAELNNGVLTLNIEKPKESIEKTKKIEIKKK